MACATCAAVHCAHQPETEHSHGEVFVTILRHDLLPPHVLPGGVAVVEGDEAQPGEPPVTSLRAGTRGLREAVEGCVKLLTSADRLID